VNQTTVTLIVSAVCMVLFWACTFLSHKSFSVKDIFSFAGLCAATITGAYICGSAMGIIKQPEPETNRLSIGILGAGLALMSAREGYMMIKVVLPKRKPPVVPAAERLTDEKAK
jgi:hypothetical protein